MEMRFEYEEFNANFSESISSFWVERRLKELKEEKPMKNENRTRKPFDLSMVI